MLIAIVVGLLVVAFIAYLVRNRLTNVSGSWGKGKVSIGANARGPGVDISEVDAAKNVSAVDQTGAGVKANKIKAGGDATFQAGGDPGKNG
jgi:hypothetical protein